MKHDKQYITEHEVQNASGLIAMLLLFAVIIGGTFLYCMFYTV